MTTIATIVSDNKIQISILILWQGALSSHWKWTVMVMMIIVARKREKWSRFIKSGAGVELALLVLQFAENAKNKHQEDEDLQHQPRRSCSYYCEDLCAGVEDC